MQITTFATLRHSFKEEKLICIQVVLLDVWVLVEWSSLILFAITCFRAVINIYIYVEHKTPYLVIK